VWVSWKRDEVGDITKIVLAIAEDDNGDLSTGLWVDSFSPNDFLVRPWGSGDQGWYSAPLGTVIEHDHQEIYEINITDISDKGEAFYQEEGTTYWLAMGIEVASGEIGCKTSPDHFGHAAIGDDSSAGPPWPLLKDPITDESLDLAFVIAPEPTTLGLVALGGLCLLRRRQPRRQTTQQ